jgi:hypothetical protein
VSDGEEAPVPVGLLGRAPFHMASPHIHFYGLASPSVGVYLVTASLSLSTS